MDIIKEGFFMTVERPTTEKEVLEMSKNYNFYTWSPQKTALEHIAVKSGEGCYFYDYEGNKYLDAASQLVNLNIGFQNQISCAISDRRTLQIFGLCWGRKLSPRSFRIWERFCSHSVERMPMNMRCGLLIPIQADIKSSPNI